MSERIGSSTANESTDGSANEPTGGSAEDDIGEIFSVDPAEQNEIFELWKYHDIREISEETGIGLKDVCRALKIAQKESVRNGGRQP